MATSITTTVSSARSASRKRGDRVPGFAHELWRDPDVLGHGQVRKETDFLEHVADPPAEQVRRDGAGGLSGDANLAGAGPNEAVDHLQRRGLARPRAADHGHELALTDHEIDAAHGVRAPAVERLGNAPELDHRRRHGATLETIAQICICMTCW
jgi:hypothetical protein